jgi:hypothetical protein
MTGSITNPKPRFGLNEDGSLFDYHQSVDIPASGELSDEAGSHWDLAKVARCIRNGEHIEAAHFTSGKGDSPRFKELEAENAKMRNDLELAVKVTAELRATNEALVGEGVTLVEEVARLRQRVQQLEQERRPETPQPDGEPQADKVEQFKKDFEEAPPKA